MHRQDDPKNYQQGYQIRREGFSDSMEFIREVDEDTSCKSGYSTDISIVKCCIKVMRDWYSRINWIFSWEDGITVALFAVLVLSFTANNGKIAKICNRKILQFLGDISYSIYLMQIFLQEPFSHGIYLPGTIGIGRGRQNIEFSSGVLYCAIYLILLILISYVTYQWIERPSRRFINRVWGK